MSSQTHYFFFLVSFFSDINGLKHYHNPLKNLLFLTTVANILNLFMSTYSVILYWAMEVWNFHFRKELLRRKYLEKLLPNCFTDIPLYHRNYFWTFFKIRAFSIITLIKSKQSFSNLIFLVYLYICDMIIPLCRSCTFVCQYEIF